jgi:hypothetical protein
MGDQGSPLRNSTPWGTPSAGGNCWRRAPTAARNWGNWNTSGAERAWQLPVGLGLGLPRISGQVSGLYVINCKGVDEMLVVVD